jgi:hypothetical protein
MEHSQQPYPNLFKPKLDISGLPVILWNLVPFAGVLFWGWKPESVFVCYAMETVIVGLFNVIKLLVVYKYGLPPKPDETGVSGLGIIPFFLVHYYFFVFVQLSIFFSGVDIPVTGNQAPWPFTGAINLGRYLLGSGVYNSALALFVLTCALSFARDFMLSGRYTRVTMGEQMFEPYPRIFLQQFVVIIGGFIFSITGNGYPVLVIFVLLKIYADLVLKDLDLVAFAKMAKQKADNPA